MQWADLTPATRRYSRRVLVAMGVYVGVLIAVDKAVWHVPPGSVLRYAMAVLPAIPLLGVFLAMGRYLAEERDEYHRDRMVRQMLIATGLTLVLTTIYGFLEAFAAAPHIDVYFVSVVWCFGLGLGSLVLSLQGR